jgi:hypothetical protein
MCLYIYYVGDYMFFILGWNILQDKTLIACFFVCLEILSVGFTSLYYKIHILTRKELEGFHSRMEQRKYINLKLWALGDMKYRNLVYNLII